MRHSCEQALEAALPESAEQMVAVLQQAVHLGPHCWFAAMQLLHLATTCMVKPYCVALPSPCRQRRLLSSQLRGPPCGRGAVLGSRALVVCGVGMARLLPAGLGGWAQPGRRHAPAHRVAHPPRPQVRLSTGPADRTGKPVFLGPAVRDAARERSAETNGTRAYRVARRLERRAQPPLVAPLLAGGGGAREWEAAVMRLASRLLPGGAELLQAVLQCLRHAAEAWGLCPDAATDGDGAQGTAASSSSSAMPPCIELATEASRRRDQFARYSFPRPAHADTCMCRARS